MNTSQVNITVEDGVHLVAEAAGSTNWHFDHGKLICLDVAQAALDAALADYDSVAYKLGVAQATARASRDEALAESDWTQATDSPLYQNQDWVGYRQALRDVSGSASWSAAPIAAVASIIATKP